MIKSRKVWTTIFAILLVLSLIFLLVTKSQKDRLQKDMDLIFTNAISDAMGGINKDYSKLNYDDKVQLYYQTVSNLHDAMEAFHSTSYKEYDSMLLALNQLYLYLLENKDETYEIDDTLRIFEFLGKVMVFPEDEKLISDFMDLIEAKRKAQY